MSKIARYLQEHLVGEVMTSVDARRYFSTDSSILTIAPSLIVYPRNENDTRKTARFSWQLAERGRVIPITPRGSGTDTTGASLGNGLMLVFPAHLNRILELDTKSGVVTVEPGINFGKLQQALKTHGRYIPPYPSSLEYSTIGGAVANNSGGERSYKFGPIGSYIKGLRVVLANGEVIETSRLSKKELNKKLGLATFEGELYRSIDTLLEESKDLVNAINIDSDKNTAGYNLKDVKRKDGSFDLTPLIVGSQGTLAILSEIIVGTEPYSPDSTLLMASFENLEDFQKAVDELNKLKRSASSIEMINGGLLESINLLNPNLLKDVVKNPFPKYILFAEFDEAEDRHHKKTIKKVTKLLEGVNATVIAESDSEHQQYIRKVRQLSGSYIGHSDGQLRAVPVIEDGAVNASKLTELLEGVDKIFKGLGIRHVAIWGHAGNGNIHLQPHLNLSQVGDRQKAFRLMDEYYKLVISLGGTISAENNDGRLRAPYLELQYGPEVYALMQKVKLAFDPYGTLNPGVKFGTTKEDIKQLLRSDYTFGHIYDHMPRS